MQRLRELYGTRDEVSLARLLGRPVLSVRSMASKVFHKRRKPSTGSWRTEDVARLKRCLGVVSTRDIARVVGRAESEVIAKVDELSRTIRAGAWTREEIQTLKELYGSRDDGTLAIVLSRTLEGIRETAARLHLGKDKAFLRRLARGVVGDRAPVAVPASRMPRWGDQEIALLRERYANRSNLQIARSLDRSVKSVVSKAHDLGLKKSEKRLATMGRENVELRYRPRRVRPVREMTMAAAPVAPAAPVASSADRNALEERFEKERGVVEHASRDESEVAKIRD